MDLNDNGGNAGGDAGSVNDLLGGGAGGDAGGVAAGDTGDAGGNTGGDTGSDFLTQFSEEVGEGQSASNRDVVKAKGWQSLDDVIKGYREAERAVRDGNRIKIPGEDATDQEKAEYRTAIGVPETPDGYERPEFKDADGKPIAYNTELTDRIFEAAHKIGLPKDAAEQLVKGEIEQQIAEYNQLIETRQSEANEHVKSWGESKEAKLAQVNAALKDLGFDRADVEHMRAMPGGVGKFLDAMAKVGANFSEDTLIKGDTTKFAQNAAAAQQEIDAMRADKAIVDKMVVPGTAENKRYERLLAIASSATVEN